LETRDEGTLYQTTFLINPLPDIFPSTAPHFVDYEGIRKVEVIYEVNYCTR
jgi:hypothetical protein